MLARLTALFLAQAMVVPSGAIGALLFVCQMDGQARTSCCCESADEEAESSATVERRSCCDVHVTMGGQPPATLDHVTQQLERHSVAVVLPIAWRGPQPRQLGLLLPLGARAPPPGTGPPIYIRNCSYLI